MTMTSPTGPRAGADEKTMRAVVQDDYGPDAAEVLSVGRVAVPACGDDGVLVRVHASSVDRGTWHIMSGLPYPIRLAGFGLRRPAALNPGRSVAGTIEAVGADVSGLAVGDEVYGTAEGAFAELAVASPGRLARTPANLSFEEAAAAPISGSTALQAVRDRAMVCPGEEVLVLGASGGVGSFAVQIARAFGAEVTGVCSAAKVDLVRSLGADHVIDYTREDPTDGTRRYDVILDIGGNRRISALRRALTAEGRLVIVGGETGGRVLGGVDRQIRAMLLSRFVGQSLGTFIASEDASGLEALRDLIEDGKVVPSIERTYPLDEAAAAVEHVRQGRARGKVVVAV